MLTTFVCLCVLLISNTQCGNYRGQEINGDQPVVEDGNNAEEDQYGENEQLGDNDDANENEFNEGIFHEQREDDDVFDSSDEEGNENEQGEPFLNGGFGNRRLYRDAPVTVRETAAALVTFMINHSLTQSCVDDLMTLLSLVCPREGFVKLSMFKLQKYFKFVAGPMNKKYYCSVCCQGLENGQQQQICPVCMMRRPVSYFLQAPLIPQFQKLFSRPGFYASLQHRFNRQQGLLQDIYDGKLYKDHYNFLALPTNFSMTFYTDGVPVYRGKNSSFWGFFLTINELPYKDRIKRENTLLAGLWFGPKQPDANLFMMSFLEDFRTLYNDGFRVHVEGHGRLKIRGMVLAGVADIPAKSSFLNCTHHNGFFGCTACEISGMTARLPNGNQNHSYPYEVNVQKRTLQRMVAQATEAAEVGRWDYNVRGVKGPTALRLFMPNFCRGFAIDPMHLIMGITRRMLELLFGPSNRGRGFSLRPVIRLVDAMLLKMKPPKFVHRYPESLEDFPLWKASQMKAWLFYYSVPILKEFMRPVFFDHYLKLVIGLTYLSSNSISLAMVDMAEQLLNDFVRDFQELYGLCFMTINLHNLTHLSECVRELGPTFVYSCFPYEDLNGQLKRAIHGKTNIDSQVARMHWQFLEMPMKLQFLHDGPLKDFCLNKKHRLKIGERVCASSYTVGLQTEIRYADEPLVFHAIQNLNVRFEKLRSYKRLLKNSLLYVSEAYTRNSRSDSCNVAFCLDDKICYGTIHTFVKALQCNCDFDCNCRGDHFAIMRLIEKVSDVHLVMHDECKLRHLFLCRRMMDVIAIPIRSLQTVCFIMEANNLLYLAEPVNSLEVE